MEDLEFDHIQLIIDATDESERRSLIDELESIPIRFYPFYDRWMRINEVYPYECWTEAGYDSKKSVVPRDLQLFAATIYGKCDIDNGGFHQFFHNTTGVFAPEMAEWFHRSGLQDVARVIRQAMDILIDGEYPRSIDERRLILACYPIVGVEREEWDPFHIFDIRFSDLTENGRYDDAADDWLRTTCGITKLSDPIKTTFRQES